MESSIGPKSPITLFGSSVWKNEKSWIFSWIWETLAPMISLPRSSTVPKNPTKTP